MVGRGAGARGGWPRLAAALGTGCVACAALACSGEATGVSACKQIEEARCNRAPACGLALQPPYSTSGSPVDACIRFYDTACLHGLEASDPGPIVVGQCVAAIHASCSFVVAPEKSPACAWLVPTASSSAADAAAEAAPVTESGTD